jgi:hypothetical protein
MQLYIKKYNIERENAKTQNVNQAEKKEKQSQEPRKNKKHELCPLAKRPSPQVLCNEYRPNKKDLANENQKRKKVGGTKKKASRGLERHCAEERATHCLSAPSYKGAHEDDCHT